MFNSIDNRIPFNWNILDIFPSKPKLTFRYLTKCVQELHRTFVLAPPDRAAKIVYEIKVILYQHPKARTRQG